MQATVKKYGFITLCCIPFALAFDCFYAPNGLTCGGFTGVAQIINHFLPFAPVGTVAFLLNLPLFILGLVRHGKGFLLSSLYAVAVSSLFVDVLAAVYTFPPMEPLLACIYGGVILGVAVGGMLRYDTTTGGTELGARLLLPRFPHLPIGKICLVMDLVVIVSYAAVFGSVLNALYGGVALYLTTVVMDMVIYGGRAAKVAYVISPQNDAISRALLESDMGVTILPARGAYTGAERPVLLAAIRRREINRVKALVKELDPDAFLIVCDAREVLGEGFNEYSPDGL